MWLLWTAEDQLSVVTKRLSLTLSRAGCVKRWDRNQTSGNHSEVQTETARARQARFRDRHKQKRLGSR